MMPSRGMAAARGSVPRLFQQQCRNLSSTSGRIPRLQHTLSTPARTSIHAQWRKTAPIAVSAFAAVRYASTTPVTPPTATTPTPSTTPAPPAESTASSFPNLDTINLDNIDLSTASDISNIPEKIGYLHEIGINYGWGPTSMIQWMLEHIHIYGDLPWWGSIAATAIALRLLTFPFYLKASDTNARQSALVSVTKPITQRMTEMQRAGNTEGVMMAYGQLKAVRQRAGISMWDQLTPIGMQAVIGYCGFKLMRALTNLPVPGFTDGGFLWLKDLTATDPYLIMPILMAASVHALVRLGGETGSMNSELNAPQMKALMYYLMPGMIFLIMGWQSGALCVWFAASGTVGIAQALLLQRPAVRRWFGLAPLYKPTKDEAGDSAFQALMASLRPAEPKATPRKSFTSGGARDASGVAGKNAAFMKPAYQAPNLQRKASSSVGRQQNFIDVKGTSTTAEMVSPSANKTGAGQGIGGMVKGVVNRYKDLTTWAREKAQKQQEENARLAKKRAAEKYESRAQSRGR